MMTMTVRRKMSMGRRKRRSRRKTSKRGFR
jgi:hypothetical protein